MTKYFRPDRAKIAAFNQALKYPGLRNRSRVFIVRGNMVEQGCNL